MIRIFYGLTIVVSVLLIIHCIKTGRDKIWVWVLIWLNFIPFAGPAAYIAFEIIPERARTLTGRRAIKGVQRAINPEGDLKRLEQEMQVSGNVSAKQRYADELVRLGRAAEAVTVYQSCLTGVFADDPKLLLGFAHAQFAAGDAAGTRRTLDDLIARNPEFKSSDGHLLYARALVGEANMAKAREEYAALVEYYPGAEAAVRYAKLLKLEGEAALARETLENLLGRAKLAPAHYRKAQREWLNEAEKELSAD